MVTKRRECWQPRQGNTTFSQQLSRCQQVSFREVHLMLLLQRSTVMWDVQVVSEDSSTGAQPRRMEHIKTYPRHSSSALHLLHSLYLHLHQDCRRDRHLLRLDMADLKAFCLQVSIRPSRKVFPNRVFRHLQVSALHQGMDHLLAKVLHPACPPGFNSQGLEELGRRKWLKAYCSRNTGRNGRTRERRIGYPRKMQEYH